MGAAGLRVVYDPDTVLYHFESSSRSSEVEEWEKELLVRRWGSLAELDPFLNPNLNHGSPRSGEPSTGPVAGRDFPCARADVATQAGERRRWGLSSRSSRWRSRG